MKQLPLLFASLLLLTAGVLPAMAQEEEVSRRSPDELAILSVIEDFVDATVAGDAERLQQLLWVNEASPTQVRVRELLLGLIAAQRRLEQAALQRYGVEGAVLGAHYQHLLTEDERKGLAEAVIFFDDPIHTNLVPVNARVFAEHQATPMRLRRGPDGRWRVVFELFDGLLADDQRGRRFYVTTLLIQRYEQNLQVVEDIEQRIRAGNLPNPGAAAAELRSKLAAVSEEYEQKRNDIGRMGR